MPTKTPVKRAEELLHPRMEEIFDPIALISLVPISKDQVLGDIGCGPGFLSIPLAKYVYDGKLYAVDLQDEMLEYVRKGAERARLHNVETVVSKENTIPLDDDVLDGAVIANTLHEASKPQSLLKEVARLVKKGGWLAVVDWLPADEDGEAMTTKRRGAAESSAHEEHVQRLGPPAKIRINADQVAEWATGLGLRRISGRELNINHYIVVFRK